MKNAVIGFALAVCGTTAMADVMSCKGTEPFWSLTISGEEIVLDKEGEVTYPSVPEKPASGHTSAYVRVYNTLNTTTGTPVNISLVKTGSCTDGMSEYVYDYQVIFQEGDTVLVGCCGE